MNEEERQRILKAGFDKFKKAVDDAEPSKEHNPFDELIGKLMGLNDEVKAHIKPILVAGGGRDPRAFEKLVHDLYSYAFIKFSKDELEQICAWMMTSTVMEGVYPSKLGVKPSL